MGVRAGGGSPQPASQAVSLCRKVSGDGAEPPTPQELRRRLSASGCVTVTVQVCASRAPPERSRSGKGRVIVTSHLPAAGARGAGLPACVVGGEGMSAPAVPSHRNPAPFLEQGWRMNVDILWVRKRYFSWHLFRLIIDLALPILVVSGVRIFKILSSLMSRHYYFFFQKTFLIIGSNTTHSVSFLPMICILSPFQGDSQVFFFRN